MLPHKTVRGQLALGRLAVSIINIINWRIENFVRLCLKILILYLQPFDF